MTNKVSPPVYARLMGRRAVAALGLALLALIAAGLLWHLRASPAGAWAVPLAMVLTAAGFVLALASASQWSSELVERRETAHRVMAR
jgi:hypothetical protein